MRSSTFRDYGHGTQTSMGYTNDGSDAIPLPSLRLVRNKYVKNFVLSPGVGYGRCMKNVKTGLSVILMIFSGRE